MATLSLVGGKGQFTWTISGLNNWFASNQYRSAGVTTQAFEGGATSITGIIAKVSAKTDPPDPSNPFSVSSTATYSSGTYMLYGFAQGSDGSYWPAGSGEVTISGSGGAIAKWDWFSSDANSTAHRILIGELPSSAGFQASVWNSIVNKTAQMLRAWDDTWDSRYASQTNTRVSSGEALSAKKYNSLRWNIGLVGDGEPYPPEATTGDEITPDHFLLLIDRLNDGVDFLNWYLE